MSTAFSSVLVQRQRTTSMRRCPGYKETIWQDPHLPRYDASVTVNHVVGVIMIPRLEDQQKGNIGILYSTNVIDSTVHFIK